MDDSGSVKEAWRENKKEHGERVMIEVRGG
jgi:hypothetical protein